MRTDRRSFDSPRRAAGGSRRGRRDEFESSPEMPYVPPDRGAERSFGGGGDRFNTAPSGPEVGAVVKWFNAEKGFGFVELNTGGDAFLHVSVLGRAGHQAVNPGAILRVRVGAGQKGPQVAEILSLEEGTAPPPTTARRPPMSGGGGGFGGAGGGGGGGREVDLGATTEVRGTVKWFNAEKGFGFVMPENGGKDVFVHITAVSRGGLQGLEPGQVVRLQVAEGRRGQEAVSVAIA